MEGWAAISDSGSAEQLLANVVLGSETAFESGSTAGIDAIALSSSLGAVLYIDLGDSNKVKICTVSDLTGTPVAGTPVDVGAGGSSGPLNCLTYLSATSALAIWQDPAGGGALKGAVITNMDTTPSVGTAFTITTGNPLAAAAVVLSSTTVAVAYAESSTALGKIRYISALTTTPSVGSAFTFESSAIDYGNSGAGIIALGKLSSTSCYAAYCTGATTLKIKRITALSTSPAVAVTTTITPSHGITQPLFIKAISGKSALVVGRDQTPGTTSGIHVLGCDGTPGVSAEIALGTIAPTDAVSFAVGKITGEDVLFTYTDADASPPDTGKTILIEGLNGYDDVTVGGAVAFNAGDTHDTNRQSLAAIGLSRRLGTVFFRDEGDSNKGKFIRIA